MKKLTVIALMFCTLSSFALTVGEARERDVVSALDQIKKDEPNLEIKKAVRTLRNEIQSSLEDANDDLAKAEAIRAPYDSVLPDRKYRVFKGKTDTSTIRKYNEAFANYLNKNLPISSKVPILVSLQDDALGRVVDNDWDVSLRGLIKFNGLENEKTKKGGQ